MGEEFAPCSAACRSLSGTHKEGIMTDANRYPLSWPIGWPRTKGRDRKRATFQETRRAAGLQEARRSTAVSMPTARNRLWQQLELLGVPYDSAILSTNVELTMHGEPRAGRREPEDPGVAVYFKLHGKDRVLACDRWDQVQGNIAAIAAHIDAIRRVDRYGVGTLDQAFAGYDALPPPGASNRPPWRKVLGFAEEVPLTEGEIQGMYRTLARKLHPDVPGGSHEAMAQLNEARDAALKELAANSQGREP